MLKSLTSYLFFLSIGIEIKLEMHKFRIKIYFQNFRRVFWICDETNNWYLQAGHVLKAEIIEKVDTLEKAFAVIGEVRFRYLHTFNSFFPFPVEILEKQTSFIFFQPTWIVLTELIHSALERILKENLFRNGRRGMTYTIRIWTCRDGRRMLIKLRDGYSRGNICWVS